MGHNAEGASDGEPNSTLGVYPAIPGFGTDWASD